MNKMLDDFKIWFAPSNLLMFNKLKLTKASLQLLKSHKFELDSNILTHLNHHLTDSKEDKSQFVLRLYFYQIFNHTSFSIDLRETNIHFTDKWEFKAKSFFTSFSPSFIEAMRETYNIFYSDNLSKLADQLTLLKLIQPDWDDKAKQEFEDLFKSHFSLSNSESHRFLMKDLINSFTLIFKFLKEKNSKIETDFALLGFYLTTLYKTLNDIHVPVNLKEAFSYRLLQD